MTSGWKWGRAWVALALVAVTPLGAGCLDAAGAAWDDVRASAGFPPEEVSAKSARNEADDAARAWNADARLAAVYGGEWSSREVADDVNESAFPRDPDVGNGRATAWVFTYVAPAGELVVTVRADGSILEEDERAGNHTAAYEAAGASPEWVVDSDDAVQKLEERESWRAGVKDAHLMMNALEFNGTGTTWVFLAYGSAGGVVGFVDPETGDVEAVHRWDEGGGSWNDTTGPWGAWSWDGGNVLYEESVSGTLTRVTPEARHAFPVTTEGHFIHFQYSVRNMPNDAVTVRVEGANGADVPLECEGPSGAVGAEQSCTARAHTAGEHTLVIALPDTGVYAEYSGRLSVWDGPPPRGGWNFCC